VGLAENREEGRRAGSLRRWRRLPPAPAGSPDAGKKPRRPPSGVSETRGEQNEG
jgi:hypothetical protein